MRRPRPATARSRFPPPIASETDAVPADHCPRPNHRQCIKCCGYQPRQQNEQQAIDIAQCRPVRRFTPEHIDLVAKNQDLRFTPCAGPQQPNERTTQQSDQLNHRPRASPDLRRFARYRVSDKDRGGNGADQSRHLFCADEMADRWRLIRSDDFAATAIRPVPGQIGSTENALEATRLTFSALLDHRAFTFRCRVGKVKAYNSATAYASSLPRLLIRSS